MEYLDIYDENGKLLGKELRNVVHEKGLWHKTVHCWLYDKEGNVYFQIRKDKNQLYTTASGHVQAGEAVKEAFGREIKEEIGIDISYEDALLVNVVPFKMDCENADGSIFRDRAFANVYVDEFIGDIQEFQFDPEEVIGIVKCNAKDTLELMNQERTKIVGTKIFTKNGKNDTELCDLSVSDFLVNKGENILDKYGDIVRKVISLVDTI